VDRVTVDAAADPALARFVLGGGLGESLPDTAPIVPHAGVCGHNELSASAYVTLFDHLCTVTLLNLRWESMDACGRGFRFGPGQSLARPLAATSVQDVT
jgi:hypothetical protein